MLVLKKSKNLFRDYSKQLELKLYYLIKKLCKKIKIKPFLYTILDIEAVLRN